MSLQLQLCGWEIDARFLDSAEEFCKVCSYSCEGMDSHFPHWNTEVGPGCSLPVLRKPMGLDNELVELVWQNGEIVLHSQTNRTQSHGPSKSKQLHQSTTGATENPNNLIQDDETNSWIDCPIDESLGKEFCANFLSEIPPFGPDEPIKPTEKPERVFKFGASVVNHVAPSPQQQDFAPPPPPPPPRFQTSDAAQLAVNKHGECSIMTVGSSHCASNQTVHEVDISWASSSGIGSRTMSETYDPKVNERETREQAITSCSRGSGSSFWKTSSQSNNTNKHKRKSMDVEESECPSDATELESAAGNKTSQKSGATRRSRVAEVHNLSERRRRDRINEKMRALQELIPHSNKSDKASMLDEAIDYMKSLQLQIQLMWMGRGMAPMMLPSMQHYMSHVGMGIRNQMLPAIMRLPLMDQAMSVAQTPDLGHSAVNYSNQMQNSSFPDQYANYMGFHSMPNASQQTNMFDFGFHSAQQKPQSNENGYENRQ